MRQVINHQMVFGQVDISAIIFREKSRDDISKLLRGLQYIYTTPEIRKRVFAILEEIRPIRKKRRRQRRSEQRSSRYGTVKDSGVRLKKLVEKVVMPKKGRLSEADKEHESDTSHKTILLWRSDKKLFFAI